MLIYMGVGGSGGGQCKKSCSNEGTIFCIHRKFTSKTGCRRDDIMITKLG